MIPTILALIVAFSGCASEDSQRAPGLKRNTSISFDREALLKKFTKAVEKDFEVISDSVADGPEKYVYWLVTVRPTRTGNFVVRHSCEYEYPRDYSLPKHDSAHHEYRFTIGQKGRQRIHYAGGFYYRVYPLARLGDRIVIPIKTHKTMVRHAFSTESIDPNLAKITAEYDAELLDLDKQFARAMGVFPLDNKASGHLRLVRTAASSIISRGLTFGVHSLTALFEAKKEGKYNLHTSAEGMERYPKTRYPKTIPVRVVSDDEDLTVLANRVYICKGAISTYWFDLEACDMRIGDKLVLHCWGYKTDVRPGETNIVNHPKVVVNKAPFSSTPVFLVKDPLVYEPLRKKDRQQDAPADADKPRR